MSIQVSFGCATRARAQFGQIPSITEDFQGLKPHFGANEPTDHHDRFQTSAKRDEKPTYAPGLKGRLQYYRNQANRLASKTNSTTMEQAALMLAFILTRLAG